MAIAAWLGQNWVSLFETLGIVGSLIYGGWALSADAKARKIQNRLAIGEQHRAIWSLSFGDPELMRVLDEKADLRARPVTPKQELFVTFLLLHLGSTFAAAKADLYVSPQKLNQDIQAFISLPIPRFVWNEVKRFQNDDFISFVEKAMNRR